MQLNLKITLLLVIIALTMGTKLKVNNARDGVKEVEKDSAGHACVEDQTLKLHLASVFQKASGYADKADVVVKANRQVDAARALLNDPNAKSIEILKEAATQLKQLLEKDRIRQDTQWTIGFNRSIYGGIKNASGENNDQAKNSLDQLGWVVKVATNTNADGSDRAGVLALLGDIGTAVMDCNYTYKDKTTVAQKQKVKNNLEEDCDIKKHVDEDKLNKAYCQTKSTIRGLFSPMTVADFNTQTKGALDERGGSAIAPRKKKDEKGCGMNKERGMKFDNLDGTPAKKKDGCKSIRLNTRSGLLNDGANIGEEKFKANWPWQTLPEEYFKCAEPWAGHYSGSILEVLFMLDTTTKTKLGEHDPFATFNKKIEPSDSGKKFNNPEQECKAALAGAFLISIGYHSAIEVKPTMWAFLGKPMPKIFSRKNPDNCDLNATEDIVTLFKKCTADQPAMGKRTTKDVHQQKKKRKN